MDKCGGWDERVEYVRCVCVWLGQHGCVSSVIIVYIIIKSTELVYLYTWILDFK